MGQAYSLVMWEAGEGNIPEGKILRPGWAVTQKATILGKSLDVVEFMSHYRALFFKFNPCIKKKITL